MAAVLSATRSAHNLVGFHTTKQAQQLFLLFFFQTFTCEIQNPFLDHVLAAVWPQPNIKISSCLRFFWTLFHTRCCLCSVLMRCHHVTPSKLAFNFLEGKGKTENQNNSHTQNNHDNRYTVSAHWASASANSPQSVFSLSRGISHSLLISIHEAWEANCLLPSRRLPALKCKAKVSASRYNPALQSHGSLWKQAVFSAFSQLHLLLQARSTTGASAGRPGRRPLGGANWRDRSSRWNS